MVGYNCFRVALPPLHVVDNYRHIHAAQNQTHHNTTQHNIPHHNTTRHCNTTQDHAKPNTTQHTNRADPCAQHTITQRSKAPNQKQHKRAWYTYEVFVSSTSFVNLPKETFENLLPFSQNGKSFRFLKNVLCLTTQHTQTHTLPHHTPHHAVVQARRASSATRAKCPHKFPQHNTTQHNATQHNTIVGFPCEGNPFLATSSNVSFLEVCDNIPFPKV